MNRCQIHGCGAAVPPGMLVCEDDANDLALELLMVPGLARALEDAHVKSMRFGASYPHGRPATDESPVPFNAGASRARSDLGSALWAWSVAVSAARSHACALPDGTTVERPEELPAGRIAVMGPWLAERVSWMRSWRMGPEAVRKLRAVIRHADSVVDRPPDLRYAGPCEHVLRTDDGRSEVCGADLYAEPGALEVRCRSCGTSVGMARRRAWLLAQAEDRLLPATEMARAIDGLGVHVTPSTIRNWAARGELARKGWSRRVRLDGRGDDGTDQIPTYRVGDVLDRVNADRARRLAKRMTTAGGPR